MRRVALTLAGIAVGLGGCVEGFRGSNVQIDFAPGTKAQAAAGATPGADELPSDVHYRLFAVDELADRDDLFEIQQFEIHHLVEPSSPCFIDAGANVPFPGVHVTAFLEKMKEKTGIPDIMMPPPTATEQDVTDVITAAARLSVLNMLVMRDLKAVTSASTGGYPAAAPRRCSASTTPRTSAGCRSARARGPRIRGCSRARIAC